MTKARRDGLCLLLLGGVVFVLLGAALENAFSVPLVDFKVLYFPARCLMQHCDPYNDVDLLRVSRVEDSARSWDNERGRPFITRYIYPPTAFSLTVPFAMLPWGPAHILWITLTAASFIFASFLMWNLGASYAPIVSGALVGFLLANSELLLITGNMAGIAIGLCLVAVWCFFRERFVVAGVLCLAISLAVKPQDTGLVWLYFLLAGGSYRKRALQTLLVTVVLSLPAVLWVWQVSPHWIAELQSNLSFYSAHGGINDPGLTSSGGHGLGMLVSLQTIISPFWDNPRIYNPASYFICGIPLLVWAIITLRSKPSQGNVWLALAAIAALSMLPVYHRQQDTKLLVLAVPACAMLWAAGSVIGRLALLVTSAGLVLTADLPWAFLLSLINNLHLSTSGLSGKMLIAVQVFPVPLTLLAMGIFYLWIYARRSSTQPPPQPL